MPRLHYIVGWMLLPGILLGCAEHDPTAGDAPADTEAVVEQERPETPAARQAVPLAPVAPGLMTGDFQVALSMRPRELFAEPLTADLLAALPDEYVELFRQQVSAGLEIEPSNVRQLVLLFGVGEVETTGFLATGTYYQLHEPLDLDAHPRLTAGAERTEYRGKVYWRGTADPTLGPRDRSIYVSENGLIVMIAAEETLKKMLDRAGADSPLGKLAAEADFSSDATLLVDSKGLRPFLQKFARKNNLPPAVTTLVSLADKLDSGVANFNLSEGQVLGGTLRGEDAERVAEAANMMTALQVIAREYLETRVTTAPQERRAALRPATQFMIDTIENIQFGADNQRLWFKLGRGEDFNDRLETAIKALPGK